MEIRQYPKVSVIILNWNGKKDTLECLELVRRVNYKNFETIVVDNGSKDGSEEAIKKAFPEAVFLQTGANLGYAEGNNVGMRKAIENGADFVFVLNNDTIVDPNVVTAIVNEAERNPKAAILGSKIYFYDRPDVINSAGGYIQRDIFKLGHIGYGFKEDNKTYSAVTSVEWITGCAILLRVSALKEVGLFDPDYFLLCEDLDLCVRVRKKGYEVLFVPESKVWHKVSASFEGNYSPVYCYYNFRNMFLYASKNFYDIRFKIYNRLLRNTRDFYRRIRDAQDPDYKSKGLFILLGTAHFFTGGRGKAPDWMFKIKPFKRKYFPVIETGKDIFKAKITVRMPPKHAAAGSTVFVSVKVENQSGYTWPSKTQNPVRLAYHIFSNDGERVSWDGHRTEMPKDLPPGGSAKLKAKIELPKEIGSYVLELDMVQEGVAWFGAKGSPTAKKSFETFAGPLNKNKIHFIAKAFCHHSNFSGYHRILDYVENDKFRCFPISKIIPKTYKKALIKNSLCSWHHYGETDLNTELDILAFRSFRGKHIFHFIYGENTFCYAANFNRKNKIVMASYHWPECWFHQQGKKGYAFFTFKMMQLDAVIAVSRNQAEFLKEYNNNVFFVPHGIDVEFFTPDPMVERDPKLCLFVGNWLRDFKTLKEVNRILKFRNSGIKLEAVTPERNRNQFENTDIEVFSGISDEELRQKYRKAALVIQPLIDCTANNAALEAMACGLPIIASDVGGIRDYLTEEYAVFCKQGNAEEMADAVTKLLDDPAKRSAMGKAAREAAEKRFAWSVVAKQMTEVYNKVLEDYNEI